MKDELTKNTSASIILKIRRKIKVLNIVGIVFLMLQLFGYLGNMNKTAPDPSSTGISYYIGYNFLLLTAVAFFINAYRSKKRLLRLEQEQIIDSIGNAE